MGSKFAASIICKFYIADFFSVRSASPINAGWFGTSIGSALYTKEKKKYAPSCRVLPIHGDIAYKFWFTWRKRKYIKIKTTAKLKAKRPSIAMIRYLCQTNATFLTPLGSSYRLPLTELVVQLCIISIKITGFHCLNTSADKRNVIIFMLNLVGMDFFYSSGMK